MVISHLLTGVILQVVGGLTPFELIVETASLAPKFVGEHNPLKRLVSILPKPQHTQLNSSANKPLAKLKQFTNLDFLDLSYLLGFSLTGSFPSWRPGNNNRAAVGPL